MLINHIYSGNNFHGDFRVILRGDAAGFTLSKYQAKKVKRAECDYEGCQCGGGYGNGLDAASAQLWDTNYGELTLTPGNKGATK